MTHFAYSRRAFAPMLMVAGCSAVLLGAFGCKAGVSASLAGSGGSGNGTGQGGSGGSHGTGGLIVTSGDGGGGGDIVIMGDAGPSDAAGCQQKDVMFTPTNPTVYLLVDRSGSMFHCLTAGASETADCPICMNTATNTVDMANTSWSHLKTAIEQVLPQLDSQVRFGFTTVYGTNPSQRRDVSVAPGDAHQQRPAGVEQRGHHRGALRRLAVPAQQHARRGSSSSRRSANRWATSPRR